MWHEFRSFVRSKSTKNAKEQHKQKLKLNAPSKLNWCVLGVSGTWRKCRCWLFYWVQSTKLSEIVCINDENRQLSLFIRFSFAIEKNKFYQFSSVEKRTSFDFISAAKVELKEGKKLTIKQLFRTRAILLLFDIVLMLVLFLGAIRWSRQSCVTEQSTVHCTEWIDLEIVNGTERDDDDFCGRICEGKKCNDLRALYSFWGQAELESWIQRTPICDY